jgi:hypothetical protein
VATREAAARAIKLVSRRFVLFVTPVAVADVTFRGLFWVLHRTLHGIGFGLALLVVFVGCALLAVFAEGVVSVMYLRAMLGQETGLRDGLEVGMYPGAAGTMVRLAAICLLWLVATVVVGAIASLFVRSVFLLLRHDRHATLNGGGGGQGWVVVVLVVYAAWISRYSFVMPMVAIRKSGGGDVFRGAVGQIKGYWGVLAALAVVEYLAEHFIGRLKAWPGIGRGEREFVVAVSVLLGAVLSTYVAALKMELAVESDAG